MRFKNRYFLCQLSSTSTTAAQPQFQARDLHRALRDAIQRQLGDCGAGLLLVSLAVKYLNPATGVAIVRIGRDYRRVAEPVLARVALVGGRPCTVKVVHVGGTIRTCQKVGGGCCMAAPPSTLRASA